MEMETEDDVDGNPDPPSSAVPLVQSQEFQPEQSQEFLPEQSQELQPETAEVVPAVNQEIAIVTS